MLDSAYLGSRVLNLYMHAKFHNLARAYSAIKGKVHQLKCIVAEHLVSIAPHNVAAIPPPKKRKK